MTDGSAINATTGTRPLLRVGMLGYGFMARVHSHAFLTIPHIFWPDGPRIRLHAIAGRTASAVQDAAARFSYARYYDSWERLVSDPEVDVFDNCGPHSMHIEPTVAAIEAGKHVLCEKPLGLTAEGAAAVLAASRAADVTVMVGFNYRFLPAVRLAYELIRAGRLGEIRQCRFHYLQQGHADLRRPLAKAIVPGEETAGAMASLGSHIIDLARWLVGEITAVSATLPRIAAERIGVDGTRQSIAWDDAVAALVEFDNGASGVLEASRVATGNRNALQFELHGSAGKLGFDLERPNELQVFFADDEATLRGTRTVSVTDPQHPYAGIWWPTGHVLGWEHAHMNEIAHFAQVAARGGSVAPLGATAEDGYRAALVADAITMSHSERRWQELPPREEEQ